MVRIPTPMSTQVMRRFSSSDHYPPPPGLGGADGAVALDMVNFQQFHMDNETWEATVGPGLRLGEVTSKMHDAGNRAMAHGVCPDVGTGGHATIVSLPLEERQRRNCDL